MDSSTGNPDPSTPTWQDRVETLSYILVHQTIAPSLHSQFFVSTRVPCFHNWAFPPFLCPSPNALPSWSLSFFLSRASRFGFPHTSWRSHCPFQQPPPCVLSSGVDPAPEQLGPEERRAYARKRIMKGRYGFRIPEVLFFVVPNLVIIALLLRSELSDPLWRRLDSGGK